MAEPSVIWIDVNDQPGTVDAEKGDVIGMLCRDSKAGRSVSIFMTRGDSRRSQSQAYLRTCINRLHDIIWRSSRTSAFHSHPFGPRSFATHGENKLVSTSKTKGSVAPTHHSRE
jgi:hypothetical protein